MSFYLVGRAFATPMTSSTDKIVLLALCEHAWDDGSNCYPSHQRLARYTALHLDSVSRSIRRLVEQGYVRVERHYDAVRHQPTHYRINARKLVTPENAQEPVPEAEEHPVGVNLPPPRTASDPSPHSVGPLPAESGVNPQGTLREPSRATYTVGLTPDGAPPGSRRNGDRQDGQVYRQDARDILAFLNKKANRQYQPVPANLDLIIARLREGATVEQCRAVIARKVREWGSNPDLERYLRPATLFGRTKWAQYQGELPATAFAQGPSDDA